jgi:transcription elongation factor Elf1
MGEWKANRYYGAEVNCGRCNRNYVVQKYVGIYKPIQNSCSWCGLVWENYSVIFDPGDAYPDGYWNEIEGKWESYSQASKPFYSWQGD